jgi:hypothetical protein
MGEYEFAVEKLVTVTVRAHSESHSREVLWSLLGSPNAQEVVLAKAGIFVSKDTRIVGVDFSIDPNSVKLINGKHTG